MRWLFWIVIGLPFAEFYVLQHIHRYVRLTYDRDIATGLIWAILIGGFYCGIKIMKRQTAQAQKVAQGGFYQSAFNPLNLLMHMLAGILFIFPGLISDVLAITLLIPQMQKFWLKLGVSRLTTMVHDYAMKNQRQYGFQFQQGMGGFAYRQQQPYQAQADRPGRIGTPSSRVIDVNVE